MSLQRQNVVRKPDRAETLPRLLFNEVLVLLTATMLAASFRRHVTS
jgi:hypothetical protein